MVAITGAGISTPSGIPDFRSRDSGLWSKYDPMAVASLTAFRHDPESFFTWIRPLVESILNAQPNPAHLALAELEAEGYLKGVITQNIDGLHRRAGSRHLFEIHGHLRQATCISCYRTFSTERYLERFLESGAPPRCPHCGAMLKPDIILYGEQLPFEVVRGAMELLEGCDLLLIAGSSLEVTPAASMPMGPLNAGAKLMIINHDPTYLDKRADVIFHEDVAEILPRLVTEVLRERRESFGQSNH